MSDLTDEQLAGIERVLKLEGGDPGLRTAFLASVAPDLLAEVRRRRRAAPSPSQSSTPSLSTAAPGDGDPSPETEGADAQGSETGGTGQLSRRAPGSLGEREDRAAKSVRVEWEDGLYTEIRGTTARGIVQFLATMYCAPGETTDTRANVVKCVCGLTLTVACPCCGAPRGEPCKHHGSALASPSPQTHDEGDRT